MQVVHRKSLLEEAAAIHETKLLLVTAPGGSGKTTLARAWAERINGDGGRFAWLSLAEVHRDPNFFIEDLIDAIQLVLPAPLDGAEPFGTALQRALPRSGEIKAEPIARLFERELRGLTQPLVVCLDAFEQLENQGITTEIVDCLLRAAPRMLRLVITTRGLRPAAWSRLVAEDAAIEIGAVALRLERDQVSTLLDQANVALPPKQVDELYERTAGWAIAVRFAIRALGAVDPDGRSAFLADLVRENDLFQYIAHELVAGIPDDVTELLEISSILGKVNRETLARAYEGTDAGHLIDRAIVSGLMQDEDGMLSLHDLLADWMRIRLQTRLDANAWTNLHLRLGKLLEDSGRGMEALRVLRAVDLDEAVAGLLAREGHGWVNRGFYDAASQALEALPEAMRRNKPELLALAGVIEGGRDPDTAIENLRIAAEMYREAGNQAAEFEALHEVAIVAVNENRMDEIIRLFRYTLTLRRVFLEPRLRGMLAMAMADGATITGRYSLALRMLRIADTFDHEPREQAGLGLAHATIQCARGEWDRALEDIDARCADENQRRHGPGYFAMRARSAFVRGLRGINVDESRETLRQASQMFVTARHTLNRFQSDSAHGQVAERAGSLQDAVDLYSTALGLAQRISLIEGEAATYGRLARVWQKLGRTDQAREAAREGLARYQHQDAWTRRFSMAPFSSPGVARAALVCAELDDAKEALRILDTKRKRLVHDELPLLAHFIRIATAKIAEHAGDAKRSRKELEQAWRIYRDHDLRDLAGEMDDELASWALSRARALELDIGRVDLSVLGGIEPKSVALQISTLGGLEVSVAARKVRDRDWRGATAKRLLARLLAADGIPIPRERIEADLWPDATRANASNNLRVALSKLRDVLEPRRQKGAPSRFLMIEGERVGLSSEALSGYDLPKWRDHLKKLEQTVRQLEDGVIDATPQDEEALRESISLRASNQFDALRKIDRGAYLPEIFDDWTEDQRREVEAARSRACLDCIDRLLAARILPLAQTIAEWLVSTDRESEAAWERLGRRSRARKPYQLWKLRRKTGRPMTIQTARKIFSLSDQGLASAMTMPESSVTGSATVCRAWAAAAGESWVPAVSMSRSPASWTRVETSGAVSCSKPGLAAAWRRSSRILVPIICSYMTSRRM